MELALSILFLSLNFSSFLRPATARGGLHTSYPPGCPCCKLSMGWHSGSKERLFACPDDETFRFLAIVYSRSHYNMSLRKEFEGGITNQAFWYPIYGGMQDRKYKNGGCFELTLEISDNKWPTANEVRHQLGQVCATFKYKTTFFSQVYHVYGDMVAPLV
ncbi:uncharacterized protein [Pyrus communis]|uniref:uncharacterized protein n=1 Tax=Pyrus communis TaxID=23211 RepID=UPI0035C23AC8